MAEQQQDPQMSNNWWRCSESLAEHLKVEKSAFEDVRGYWLYKTASEYSKNSYV